MLFDECGCCNCGYRVQVLPSGFGGSVINDGLHALRADLFVRSLSVELRDGNNSPVIVRPAASATAIDLAIGPAGNLRFTSDEDYVELEFEQSPGHVLRMTFEGENTLLDSDDPVTLTVDEDSLDDTAWPEDLFGRDYLTRDEPTWQVRVIKPVSPCRCRVCYCGQEASPIDLEGAPAAYTLQFIEGFADEESEFYGPDLPLPFYRWVPGGPFFTPSCYDVCAPGQCVPDISRWASSFSLKKMTAEELVAAGMDPIALAYASEKIPVNSCESIRYLFLPCSTLGFASLGLLGGDQVLAATGTRPGWKFADYTETPANYRSDLFDNAIEFGVATLTASESHEAFENEECPERAPDVPEEMIVEIYGESCEPLDCGDLVEVTGLGDGGGSYTLTLDAENSTECVAIWEYSESDADPNLGDNELYVEQPALRIRLECHNEIGGVECLCEGGTWYLSVQGLSPEYVSRRDENDNNVTSRMPWFFGQLYKDGNQVPASFNGILPFSDDYAGDEATCRPPCEANLELDQPEEHIENLGAFARPGRLYPLGMPAVGNWTAVGIPYPGIDPDTGENLPGGPPANGPRAYKGFGGYKITPG